MIFCLKCETEIKPDETYGEWDHSPYHWQCLLEALLERISTLEMKIQRLEKRRERDE